MSHIFISYSHKDKDYVHKLQEALQKEGFDVWIDDRVDYGTRWPKVIQDQLDSCAAFIVVVSENSYKSKWVQNEVVRADRKLKPFFPFLLQGDPWLSVEATQYVDVTDGSMPTEKFYERLEKVMPRKKSGADTPSSLLLSIQNKGKTDFEQLVLTNSLKNIPDVSDFLGRQVELRKLYDWVVQEKNKVVMISALGGMGKTLLAAKFARTSRNAFEHVFWISLLSAPPLVEILRECIQEINSETKIDWPHSINDTMQLFVSYLQKSRCLLVFDNMETLLLESV